MSNSRGFTLIEILVVVTIIGILAAAFLPDIIGAGQKAGIAADKANLEWHYKQIYNYKDKRGFPDPLKYSGPSWVLAPWVVGDVQRTDANFNRYFTPGRPGPGHKTLKDIGPDEIWKSIDDITSLDTDYAGPSAEHARGMRSFSGREPLMATDNEGTTPVFEDGSINVLMGDASVKTLILDDFLEYGWTKDQVEEAFPVGPDSPHPLLQKLDPGQ